ncbi:flavodoxin family protein [Enterocloster lavalensis]|uniref:flavodoxin family protein n=2 Tax=Enterocloster lavalensis TaxID=460384 RepID=UPI002FD88BE8
MKVLLINGSPHGVGCTYTALEEVARALHEDGVETELIQIGNGAVHGCIGCGHCKSAGCCVFTDDQVNEAAAKLREADGLVVGSPVYYASPNGSILAFLDRLFMSGGGFRLKPAAAIASARRAGTTATVDAINKYFSLSGMPIVSSNYFHVIHGNTPEEAKQDEEGMQTMRTIGHNMAWLLKCIEAGRGAGVAEPVAEGKIKTNFIR